jgi:hypothetical protein
VNPFSCLYDSSALIFHNNLIPDLMFYDIFIISRSLGGLTGDDAKMTNDLIEDLGGNIVDDENNENSYPV